LAEEKEDNDESESESDEDEDEDEDETMEQSSIKTKKWNHWLLCYHII